MPSKPLKTSSRVVAVTSPAVTSPAVTSPGRGRRRHAVAERTLRSFAHVAPRGALSVSVRLPQTQTEGPGDSSVGVGRVFANVAQMKSFEVSTATTCAFPLCHFSRSAVNRKRREKKKHLDVREIPRAVLSQKRKKKERKKSVTETAVPSRERGGAVLRMPRDSAFPNAYKSFAFLKKAKVLRRLAMCCSGFPSGHVTWFHQFC